MSASTTVRRPSRKATENGSPAAPANTVTVGEFTLPAGEFNAVVTNFMLFNELPVEDPRERSEVVASFHKQPALFSRALNQFRDLQTQAAPAAPDAYPGALPPAETTVAVVSEQTGVPADRMADQVKEVVNTTLQDALDTGKAPAPPAVDSEAVATHQLACFDRAIGRARALAYDENRTTIDIGADLQEAIDSFKCLIRMALGLA